MSFHVPNKYRVHQKGARFTDAEYGNNGIFWVPSRDKKQMTPLRVIASDGESWEHVSVSLPTRCPNWDEMCRIKNLFWDAEDCAMQLHPPQSEWICNHPYVLHLWRPMDAVIPRPPDFMVGIKELGVLHAN